MKKTITILAYLLYPAALASVLVMFVLLDDSGVLNFFLFPVYVILCYALPFVGLIQFSETRPFSPWLLFVGFLPASLPIYIYEYFNPDFLQYFFSHMTLVLYTIPFVIFFFLVAARMSLTKERPPYLAAYLLYPFVLSAIGTYLFAMSYIFPSYPIIGCFVIILGYLASFYGAYVFLKKRPFNQWFLPAGFLLTPIPICFFEKYFLGHHSLTYTPIVIYIFTIPAIVISLAVAAALTFIKKSPPRELS